MPHTSCLAPRLMFQRVPTHASLVLSSHRTSTPLRESTDVEIRLT